MPDSRKTFYFVLIALAFAVSFMGERAVWAQADFYKGKTITVYIGTTPGALYDQWGRLLAQHMGKHIPGKPELIVQNMPGAGHMIAANYVRSTRGSKGGAIRLGEICLDRLTGAR